MFTIFSQARIATMLSVCNGPWNASLKWSKQIDPRNFANLLDEMSFNLSQTIVRCETQDKKQPCKDIITKVLTSVGICFTYNIKNSSMIYRDDV